MKFSLKYLAAACAVIMMIFCGTSFADDTITFSGKLSISYEGKKIEVNGSQNINIPSEMITVETQDDDPAVMGEVFFREGFNKRKPDMAVKASKPFTVSGERVNGIFALRRKGGNAKLVSVGGRKSPYKFPKIAGEYYIGIDYVFPEDAEDEIDAAILQYLKISVQ